MRAAHGLAAAALLAVIGISASPAGATTKAQLKAKALPLSAMPMGWSVDHSSGSSSSAPACLRDLKAPAKHVVRAEVTYTDGNLPSLDEVLETGIGATARYAKFNKALAKCKSISFDTGGKTIKGTIGAMSFPRVGSRSAAYAITVPDHGLAIGLDIVLVVVGAYVVALDYSDLGQPDPQQLRRFVNKAVAMVEGKPKTGAAVTTTTVGHGAAVTTTTFPNGADNPPPGYVTPPVTTTTAPPRTVPNVMGDTEAQAGSIVSAAGLTPQFTTDTGCAGGSVDSQNPAPGTTVRSGSTVSMGVCGGSTTTTAPGGATTTTQQGLL